MIFKTESDLTNFAEKLGKHLPLPAVFELVGDVGAGKTTFTRGLAKGLGVRESVSSPSFTISKCYAFPLTPENRADSCEFEAPEFSPTISDEKSASTSVKSSKIGTLFHYDFYRLDEPGIMADDLAEAVKTENSVVVVEWGDSIKNLLPANHFEIIFKIQGDDARELVLTNFPPELLQKITPKTLPNNKIDKT